MNKLWVLSLLLLVCLGCEERVMVNAPTQEIPVIYGILDPSKVYQDIRISRVYQIEEDAFEAAKNLDPSVPNLRVILAGDGKTWRAVEIDGIQKDTLSGDFGDFTRVYRFFTPIDSFLRYGKTYELTIYREGDSVPWASAYTRVPPQPTVLQPAVFRNGGEQCKSTIRPEDSVLVSFFPQFGKFESNAFAFDVQASLKYKVNGRSREAWYNIPRFFTNGVGCVSNFPYRLCYQIGTGDILSAWLKDMKEVGTVTYTPGLNCLSPSESFNRTALIHVVSVDTFLGKYTIANQPLFNELNTVRKAYTNIEATPKGLGIFGSIARREVPVDISDCAAHLLGLRSNRPDGCSFP